MLRGAVVVDQPVDDRRWRPVGGDEVFEKQQRLIRSEPGDAEVHIPPLAIPLLQQPRQRFLVWNALAVDE